jgi:hypothetical protein
MIAQKKARDCLKKIPKEFCSIAILPHFLLFLPPLCNEKLQKNALRLVFFGCSVMVKNKDIQHFFVLFR